MESNRSLMSGGSVFAIENNPNIAPSSLGSHGLEDMHCNRCLAPLTTTCFVCACDCVFCEDCTYAHFNTNPNCPSCDRTLSADDFMEVSVSAPTAAATEPLRLGFQSMFTKPSSNVSTLKKRDMAMRVLRAMDENKRFARFLFKQFIMSEQKESARNVKAVRDQEQLKKELTDTKQSFSSYRIQNEQHLADVQNRLHVTEARNKELEQLIAQFRERYHAESLARIPSSNHSSLSGEKRVRSSGSGSGHHQSSMLASASPPPPPIQSFLMKEEARERAKKEALEQALHGRHPSHPSYHHRPPSSASTNSLVSPMVLHQVPPSRSSPAYSDGLHLNGRHAGSTLIIPTSSSSSRSPVMHHASQSHLPRSARIRDVGATASSSGYVFHAGSSRGGGSNSLAFAYNQPRHSRASSSRF